MELRAILVLGALSTGWASRSRKVEQLGTAAQENMAGSGLRPVGVRPVLGRGSAARPSRLGSRSEVQMSSTPPLWDAFWKLPALKPGAPGSAIGFSDYMRGIKSGFEEQYMGIPNSEGVPEGVPSASQGDDLFESLRSLYDQFGPVYKIKLGILSVISVADPVMIRHILKSRGSFDKGLLGLVSEDIFGQGLITATDKDVWQTRRSVVAPGFHKRWIRSLAEQFAQCTSKAFPILDAAGESGESVDLESIFLNLGLDIVGKTVFNFDFGSVDAEESPVVKAVYRLLKETVYRAENPLLLALAQVPEEYSYLLPEAEEFRKSFQELDTVLDDVIKAASDAGINEQDIETLQSRDLENIEDRSLLRFLLDVRGQNTSNARLKDDLRTLLIAGHETVSSIMTWATFELAKNPHVMAKVRDELDTVLGGKEPTYKDVERLEYLRLVITEALRMYPAPPVLLRRALRDEVLPEGSEHGNAIPLQRGSLIILQMAMLHRSPALYDSPDEFRPERWLKPFGPSSAVKGWEGYHPERVTGLGPNEVAADYAFVPFGAGEFKCVGDQFAMMEATVVLAMFLQRYDFTPTFSTIRDVGIDIAATIHTKNGLGLKVRRRKPEDVRLQ